MKLNEKTTTPAVSGTDPASIGARAIPEFAGVHDVWPRGERLQAVRTAAAAYKERFKAQGQVLAVRSIDIAAAPYPVKYAFHDAISVPSMPLISMINRMIVVRERGGREQASHASRETGDSHHAKIAGGDGIG